MNTLIIYNCHPYGVKVAFTTLTETEYRELKLANNKVLNEEELSPQEEYAILAIASAFEDPSITYEQIDDDMKEIDQKWKGKFFNDIIESQETILLKSKKINIIHTTWST